MKRMFILILPVVFLSSCIFQQPEGTVHYYYRVTGNAPDVTIHADGYEYNNVTSLPWQSVEYSQHVDDNTHLSCGIEAVNNTTDNATITVEIYIDGDLKASDTATGPNCMAHTDYTFSNTDL